MRLVPCIAWVASSTIVLGALNDGPVRGGRSGALRLEELTQSQVNDLDRRKTIFFLTFGNLEEHGPHLPTGADFFRAEEIRDRLIARLRTAHPDYHFVLFPTVPLGEGGANDAVGQPDHIGTFSVRFDTLRSVAIDLGGTIARKGFENIFIIEGHGATLHNVAFNQAAKFVSERYGVSMVNITGLSKSMSGDDLLDRYLGPDWRKRSAFEGHAGADGTSETLATHGAIFVAPLYKSLAPFYVEGLSGFLRTHELKGWPGYWGDPARASKELGQALVNRRVDSAFRIAEKVLAREDVSTLVAYPDNTPAMVSADVFVGKSLARYKQQEEEIASWLARNPWPAKH